MVNFKENYHIFQGSGGGPTFSRGGGSNFFQRRSNCLFHIETHITCDFLGGGGGGGLGGTDPLSPPLDPHFIIFLFIILTLYLIDTPFNAFANRTDPDQAALIRAA